MALNKAACYMGTLFTVAFLVDKICFLFYGILYQIPLSSCTIIVLCLSVSYANRWRLKEIIERIDIVVLNSAHLLA